MPLTGKALLRLALKDGWELDRVNGSHHILVKAGHPPVSIPVHGNKDLTVAMEKKLRRGLGL
jgi:predicted RNA binding protein YcfA (HicA-like mRNA interferase family)